MFLSLGHVPTGEFLENYGFSLPKLHIPVKIYI